MSEQSFSQRPDLQSLLHTFAVFHDRRGLASGTVRSYVADIRQLDERLTANGVDILLATETNLRNDILILKHRKAGPSSIARYSASAHRFFEFLAETGVRSENPLQHVPIGAKRQTWKPSRCLSRNQLVAVLTIPDRATPLGARNYLILKYLMTTKLRSSTIARLTTHDIFNHGRKGIRVQHRNTESWVALSDELLAETQEFVANWRPNIILEKPTDCLFPTRRSDHSSMMTRQAMWHILKHCARRAGVRKDMTGSDLRNSYFMHCGVK